MRVLSGRALAAGSAIVRSRQINHPPLARCGSLRQLREFANL